MKSVLGLTVNGRAREDAVADNALLIDYLREQVGLTGTKMGCDGGECGACTVLIDGAAVLHHPGAWPLGHHVDILDALIEGQLVHAPKRELLRVAPSGSSIFTTIHS